MVPRAQKGGADAFPLSSVTIWDQPGNQFTPPKVVMGGNVLLADCLVDKSVASHRAFLTSQMVAQIFGLHFP